MSVGDLFGLPIIESPLVPEGQAYVLSGQWPGWLDSALELNRYTAGPWTVQGHVERKANEIRRRWGLEEVDYAAEHEAEQMRRYWRRMGDWLASRPDVVTTLGWGSGLT